MPNVFVAQFSAPTQPFVLSNELGEPIDLTGATLKFSAKRVITDPDASKLFEVTATPDADQVANKGRYTLAFDYNKTSVPPGEYPAALRYWAGSTSVAPQKVEVSTYSVSAGLLQT